MPRYLVALLTVAIACSPADDSGASAPASAEPTPAEAPAVKAKRGPSQRILGSWLMNLNDVPKEALTEEMRKYKKSEELADMVRVEYTVTETEWKLRKYGAGGVYDQTWHYEILKEVDDVLVLSRIDKNGEAQQIQVLVGDDKMVIGTGSGKVPLTRLR